MVLFQVLSRVHFIHSTIVILLISSPIIPAYIVLVPYYILFHIDSEVYDVFACLHTVLFLHDHIPV